MVLGGTGLLQAMPQCQGIALSSEAAVMGSKSSNEQMNAPSKSSKTTTLAYGVCLKLGVP